MRSKFAALLAVFALLFAATPASAVTDKETLTKTCSVNGTVSFSVKLSLNGVSTGYQPQAIIVIGKTGATENIPYNGFRIYWYNSAGTLLQVIDYGKPTNYVTKTAWVRTNFTASQYTTQNNYLWQATLKSNNTNLCTTAKST